MEKTYKSRVSTGLVAFLSLFTLALFLLSFARGFNWILLALAVISALTFGGILFSNRYTLTDDTLYIRSAYGRTHIAIHSIRSIEECYNYLSYPAASFRRLKIRYGKYAVIYISPEEQIDFVRTLLRINPSIELKAADNPSDFEV